jgi:hypothetical protein
MKVGQNTIVRWVAKLVAKEPASGAEKAATSLRVVGGEQLRQVAGGTGNSSQLPHKGW